MLHRVFVGVRDLQPTNKRSGNHVIVAIIHQGHMVLKITDVMFEALSGLHLHHGEVIVLKLLSGSILVIESMFYLFETPERVPRERVKPVVGDVFETR